MKSHWVTAIQIFRDRPWSPDEEFSNKREAIKHVNDCIQRARQQQLDRRLWAVINFDSREVILR